jgi:hypothetical protein
MKLVYKGKLLKDEESLQHYESGTRVYVSLSKVKEKKQEAQKFVLPEMQTGQENYTPVGVGSYSMHHMPEYHSAIRGLADPNNMDSMLNDPNIMSQMEELLKDPETMQRMMDSNPMLRRMTQDNPALKAYLSNPDFMRLSLEMLKNRETSQSPLQPAPAPAPAPAPQAQPMGFPPSLSMALPGWGLPSMRPQVPAPVVPASPGPVNLQEKYRKEIDQLERELGEVDREQCARVLEQCGGDLGKAIDRLFGQ